VSVVEPVVPHGVAVGDRNVLKDSIEELKVGQLHRLAAAVTMIRVPEPDEAVVHAEDAPVGDRPAFDVSGQIGGHAVAVSVLTLDANVPLLLLESGQQTEQIMRAHAVWQSEQAIAEGLADEGDHLALVQGTHQAGREKVSLSGLAPVAFAIQATTGNQTVYVRVQDQCATPGMEGTDQARLGAEVPVITQ